MKLIRAWKAYRAWKRGLKEGERMADKSMVVSATVWGVVIAEAPKLLEATGQVMQGKIDLPAFLSAAAMSVGIIIAAIGARRAVGKVIASGNGNGNGNGNGKAQG